LLQKCRKCLEDKHLSDFEFRNDSQKYRTECRSCRYTAVTAQRYGMTSEQLLAMYALHGERCAICGSDGKSHATFERLVVDHCHETQQVRGLLCSNCNAGLGQFKDSPRLLEAAMQYLERTK